MAPGTSIRPWLTVVPGVATGEPVRIIIHEPGKPPIVVSQ
jgi:hypothetical protein